MASLSGLGLAELDELIAELAAKQKATRAALTAALRRRSQLRATAASSEKRKAATNLLASHVHDRWIALGGDGLAMIAVASEVGLSLRSIYRLRDRMVALDTAPEPPIEPFFGDLYDDD